MQMRSQASALSGQMTTGVAHRTWAPNGSRTSPLGDNNLIVGASYRATTTYQLDNGCLPLQENEGKLGQGLPRIGCLIKGTSSASFWAIVSKGGGDGRYVQGGASGSRTIITSTGKRGDKDEEATSGT
eukprot:Gb_39155 [translate_table: standard]